MEQRYDELYKVVLVGDPGVGKTNLLATFLASDDAALLNVDGVVKTFSPTKKPTIGVEFGTKIIHHPNGTRIKAQIWDTAGQERYRAITSSHYRRAAGALVIYDVASNQSFESAQKYWLKELKASADAGSALSRSIMIVGNKIDLETANNEGNNNELVSQQSHEAAIKDLRVMGARASAKTGANVRSAFEQLIISIYEADNNRLGNQGRETLAAVNSPKTAEPVIRLEDVLEDGSMPGSRPTTRSKCCSF